jgi:hypothetical protein
VAAFATAVLLLSGVLVLSGCGTRGSVDGGGQSPISDRRGSSSGLVTASNRLLFSAAAATWAAPNAAYSVAPCKDRDIVTPLLVLVPWSAIPSRIGRAQTVVILMVGSLADPAHCREVIDRAVAEFGRPIWTPLIPSTMPPEQAEEFGKNTPLGQPGQPAELAPMYVLLASDEGQPIAGAGGPPVL